MSSRGQGAAQGSRDTTPQPPSQKNDSKDQDHTLGKLLLPKNLHLTAVRPFYMYRCTYGKAIRESISLDIPITPYYSPSRKNIIIEFPGILKFEFASNGNGDWEHVVDHLRGLANLIETERDQAKKSSAASRESITAQPWPPAFANINDITMNRNGSNATAGQGMAGNKAIEAMEEEQKKLKSRIEMVEQRLNYWLKDFGTHEQLKTDIRFLQHRMDSQSQSEANAGRLIKELQKSMQEMKDKIEPMVPKNHERWAQPNLVPFNPNPASSYTNCLSSLMDRTLSNGYCGPLMCGNLPEPVPLVNGSRPFSVANPFQSQTYPYGLENVHNDPQNKGKGKEGQQEQKVNNSNSPSVPSTSTTMPYSIPATSAQYPPVYSNLDKRFSVTDTSVLNALAALHAAVEECQLNKDQSHALKAKEEQNHDEEGSGEDEGWDESPSDGGWGPNNDWGESTIDSGWYEGEAEEAEEEERVDSDAKRNLIDFGCPYGDKLVVKEEEFGNEELASDTSEISQTSIVYRLVADAHGSLW
ncbi:hypothetical protein NPX13_g2892 [Xylaria arbuscula]|uniref:Uncharacterized protein n=1 Tax=Xylaria arbuscula TaxID=114810 RepID=A0A9W8NJ86_9PEZI|nr:hypothetical protein NPX13_g2892 [Xylaria arbuscula]